MSAQNKNAFTLIELLVVVAIIAILSIIGLAIFTDNLKKARDATRKGDIDAIASALEAHYTLGNATPYPIPLAGWFSSGVIPQDPQGATLGYFWNGGAANTRPAEAKNGYVVCADLEKDNTGNSANSGNSTFTFTTPTENNADFYCRRNLQ